MVVERQGPSRVERRVDDSEGERLERENLRPSHASGDVMLPDRHHHRRRRRTSAQRRKREENRGGHFPTSPHEAVNPGRLVRCRLCPTIREPPPRSRSRAPTRPDDMSGMDSGTVPEPSRACVPRDRGIHIARRQWMFPFDPWRSRSTPHAVEMAPGTRLVPHAPSSSREGFGPLVREGRDPLLVLPLVTATTSLRADVLLLGRRSREPRTHLAACSTLRSTVRAAPFPIENLVHASFGCRSIGNSFVSGAFRTEVDDPTVGIDDQAESPTNCPRIPVCPVIVDATGVASSSQETRLP